ncbi:putative reverse transcriptase domain-containing protein, partial [Tanacetum coccineum]
DARVVVEAIDRDETETGVRGPVEVRVETEPAQEGSVEVTYETLGDLVQRFHDHTQAIPDHHIQTIPDHHIQTIEGVQREQGHRIVGVESAVIALAKRVAELERDNRRLRGTVSVENATTFSALLDVAPTTLDTSYAVELADGRISETNIVLRGCTLGLLGHPFDIDLMPVEHGSFDVIIGMDWLAKYHALIVYDEKVIRIPYGNEVLIIRGDNYYNEIMSKKAEDKSEERRLEDVQIVREFPEVFPENLPGLPSARQVEFQIDKLNLLGFPEDLLHL